MFEQAFRNIDDALRKEADCSSPFSRKAQRSAGRPVEEALRGASRLIADGETFS